MDSSTPAPSGPLVSVVRAINTFNEVLGRGLSWLTFFMVIVTFLVVVLRYVFNLGWIGMQESITYMHALVFMLGAAYTLKRDGHVRVDILYREMSPRKKAWVDLIGALFLLTPTFLFILIASWDYVQASWHVLEASPEAGGLPLVFLLKTAIPVMAVLMLLQGLSQALTSVLVISGKATAEVLSGHHDEIQEGI